MSENLPAKTNADRQRERMDKLLAAVDQRSQMLRTLLEDTGVTFERFVEVIRRALIRNPDLVMADAGSVIEACINAATDGLLPDGRQAAFVIYKNRAAYQPMYQGLLDIAYASGNFRSIEARVVYDGDAFEYQLGDNPYINHRPRTRPQGTQSPPIVAAYAVAKTVNGGVFREVFEGADIAKVNAVSRATKGPAKDWPEEMARKGPLRRMWKFLPKNEAMNRVVERDNEGFDLDGLDEAPAAPRKLTPGFAPSVPALPQGADPVMPDMEAPSAEADDDRVLAEAGGVDAAGDDPGAAGRHRAEHPAPDEGDGLPEGSAPDEQDPPASPFEAQLASAAGWLAVKQALKTFRKTEPTDQFDRVACSRCWARMEELQKEGKDRTDFITDPWLFECWLMGSEQAQDPDSVRGNWAIVQADRTYEKLPEADRERIASRAAECAGERV